MSTLLAIILGTIGAYILWSWTGIGIALLTFSVLLVLFGEDKQ